MKNQPDKPKVTEQFVTNPQSGAHKSDVKPTPAKPKGPTKDVGLVTNPEQKLQ